MVARTVDSYCLRPGLLLIPETITVTRGPDYSELYSHSDSVVPVQWVAGMGGCMLGRHLAISITSELLLTKLPRPTKLH